MHSRAAPARHRVRQLRGTEHLQTTVKALSSHQGLELCLLGRHVACEVDFSPNGRPPFLSSTLASGGFLVPQTPLRVERALKPVHTLGAGSGMEDHGGSFVLPLSPTTHVYTTGPVFLVSGDSLPRLQQQLFRNRRRGVRLQTLLLAALVFASLLSFFEPHINSGLREVLLRRGMSLPPPARDLEFPVQSCCIGEQCLRNSKGRHAVVTHVRNQREVTQLQVRCTTS